MRAGSLDRTTLIAAKDRASGGSTGMAVTDAIAGGCSRDGPCGRHWGTLRCGYHALLFGGSVRVGFWRFVFARMLLIGSSQVVNRYPKFFEHCHNIGAPVKNPTVS
jgi:hypothetical protein